MSYVHVYPVCKRHGKKHQTSHVISGKTLDCWCEPSIQQAGVDNAGDPAILWVHADKQDWRRKPVKP